ncbi:hypothetical protein [Geodermatophilus sp. SYSU D01176]
MSAISGSRAAVFTQQSQSVEVFLDGAWWPGSLLGWRHDGGGSCEVWVRVSVDGRDRETWTDLAEVRLPEPHPAPAPASDVGAGPFAALGEELLPGATAVPAVSLSEAAAREQRVAGVLPASAPAAVRRRRRHGGDGTAEMPAAHGGTAGRHRASAVAGRHRAADALPQPEEAPRPAARAEVSADATVLMPRATEADCLTRPLRLGDRVPRPRLARPDEAVRG